MTEDPDKWTAYQVIDALMLKLLERPTIAKYPEFTVETEEDERYCRRCDLLCIWTCGASDSPFLIPDEGGLIDRPYRYLDPPPSRLPVGWRVGFEVKVSRSDLKADLNDRWKQYPVQRLVHEFYFVTPEGLVGEDDRLPWSSGLIEVHRDRRRRWFGTPRAAVRRPAGINWMPDTPNSFLCAVAKRSIYGRAWGGERGEGRAA